MGMFDYIKYEAPCPICGTTLGTWQSKDGSCALAKLTPADLVANAREEQGLSAEATVTANFYEDCPECRTWVETRVEVRNR